MLLHQWGTLLLVVLATHTNATVEGNELQQQQEKISTTQWPSLLFVIKTERSFINGHTDFSIVANPIVSANESTVAYDIFATFTVGTNLYNYTRVGSAAYLETMMVDSSTSLVQCLQSELDDLPPIDAIIAAVNQATPVSNQLKVCTSKDVYQVTVGTLTFALCASSNSGFEMFAHDLKIAVSYLDEPVNIIPPNYLEECITEVKPSQVSSIGRSLLTGEQVVTDESRSLFSFAFAEDACSCKSKPRPCVFIHGFGVKEEFPVLRSSLRYWGNFIADRAPCCTVMKFAQLNTVNYTWTNATQQQKVCDRALAVSHTSSGRLIKDTIIVSHSMGSLILAGAIANGTCKLDASTTWVSTGAPMFGTMASDFAQKVCTEDTNLLAEELAVIKHQCPVKKALKSLVYQNGLYITPSLREAYAAAQGAYRKNVDAAMCSEGYSGILSSHQVQFWLLAKLIPHKSHKNDGTVEFQSCVKGLNISRFHNTYKSRFYRTKLNHFDMQFRTGDSIWNEAKMPLKWFECLL